MATFIRYVENGLPQNTILFSEARNLQWKVMCRILWMHTTTVVTRFSNEKESLGHARYINPENIEKDAIERELNLGLEYLLQPVDHHEKPLDGEYLIIKTI